MLASLYTLKDSFNNQELFDTLNSILNLEDYFKWQGINKLLKNGDFLDEVFFYALPNSVNSSFIFRITAWDYEDIFKPPHSGNGFSNSLLYCNEEPFDVIIAEDSVLYNSYKKTFKKELEQDITASLLDEIENDLNNTLVPLFNDSATGSIMNNFYSSGEDAKTELENLISDKINYIKSHRDSILQVLSQ